MKNILMGLVLLLVLISCEKEIEVDLNSSSPQFVIEAELTTIPGSCVVKISKTVNFSDPNSYPPVQDAIVEITDNLGNTAFLTETAPGIYQAPDLQGISGRTYQLKINADGNVFMAQSTLPPLVMLDSVEVVESATSIPPGSDNNYTVFPKYNDPQGIKNAYRFIPTVNGVKVKSFIVQNDNAVDGLANSRPLFTQDIELKIGDTLDLEMQCIDLAVYDYFFSLNQSSGEGGGLGGGTTPANPVSNITGGALGYFSAHSTITQTVVVR